jgi:O-Antigen ligase
MITLGNFRNNLLLLVISLYLLLNVGFMQVRIPPTAGSGIPIGELLLLFSLITINYDTLLPRMSVVIPLLPFMIWWALGLGCVLMAVPEYGFWSFRDANHVIESLFLVVGFAFAKHLQMLERFFSWLKNTLIFVCIYAVGYPFKEILQPLSPKFTAGAGYEVPLLFNYTETSSIVLLAVGYYLLPASSRVIIQPVVRYFTATFLLGFTMFMFQARTIYLQITAISLLFVCYRRRSFNRVIMIILVLFGFVVIMPTIGLHIKGRMREVSLEFFIDHFLAIAGVENEGVEGAARGVPQRLDWWRDLYERWTSNTSTFLFGLGYGFPLINFQQHEGITVREPHNSYISIVARLGLLGGLAFVWIHILLLRVWYHTYRACGRMGWREGENRLLILMIFFILVWVAAIGEDAFEKPYSTIPYYFFWGIVLRMNWHWDNNSPKSMFRIAATQLREQF